MGEQNYFTRDDEETETQKTSKSPREVLDLIEIIIIF